MANTIEGARKDREVINRIDEAARALEFALNEAARRGIETKIQVDSLMVDESMAPQSYSVRTTFLKQLKAEREP